MPIQKILTKHPSKSGRNIDRGKYLITKRAMLSVLGKKHLTHNQLMAGMKKKLTGRVDWNIFWYAETVKLDLEARKIIARTADRPQKYFLRSK